MVPYLCAADRSGPADFFMTSQLQGLNDATNVYAEKYHPVEWFSSSFDLSSLAINLDRQSE